MPRVLNFSACCMGSTLRRQDSSLEWHNSHGLDELLDLLLQATDVCICFCWAFVDLHRFDTGVVFCNVSTSIDTRVTNPPAENRG